MCKNAFKPDCYNYTEKKHLDMEQHSKNIYKFSLDAKISVLYDHFYCFHYFYYYCYSLGKYILKRVYIQNGCVYVHNVQEFICTYKRVSKIIILKRSLTQTLSFHKSFRFIVEVILLVRYLLLLLSIIYRYYTCLQSISAYIRTSYCTQLSPFL